MGKCISKPVAVDPPEKPSKNDHLSDVVVEAEKSTAAPAPAPAPIPAVPDADAQAKGSDRSLQQLFAKDEEHVDEDEEDNGQLKRIPEEDSSAEEQEEDVRKKVAAAAADDDSGVLETIAEHDDNDGGSDSLPVPAESGGGGGGGGVEKQELIVADKHEASEDPPAGEEKKGEEEERPSTPEISDSKPSPAAEKEHKLMDEEQEEQEEVTAAPVAAAASNASEQLDEDVKHGGLATQDSDKFELVLKPQVSEKFEIDIAAAGHGAASTAEGTEQVPHDQEHNSENPGGHTAAGVELVPGQVDVVDKELPAMEAPPLGGGGDDKDGVNDGEELGQSGEDNITHSEGDELLMRPGDGGGDTGSTQTVEKNNVDDGTSVSMEPGSTAEKVDEGEKDVNAGSEEEQTPNSGSGVKPDSEPGDSSAEVLDSKKPEAEPSASTGDDSSATATAPQAQAQEEFFEASEQLSKV